MWAAQLLLIGGYTLLITLFLPEYWLHPYGPISKNLPLMAAICLAWAAGAAMDYLSVKWLHILSSTVLFGAGIGSAFYLLLATLGRDARAVATVSRYVVISDWVFTATTAVIQPLTGFWLMHLAGGFPGPRRGLRGRWALRIRHRLLDTGGVDPVAAARSLGAGRRRRRRAAPGLLAPFPLVGGIGLPRFLCLHRHLLSDGGQAVAAFFPEGDSR